MKAGTANRFPLFGCFETQQKKHPNKSTKMGFVFLLVSIPTPEDLGCSKNQLHIVIPRVWFRGHAYKGLYGPYQHAPNGQLGRVWFMATKHSPNHRLILSAHTFNSYISPKDTVLKLIVLFNLHSAKHQDTCGATFGPFLGHI